MPAMAEHDAEPDAIEEMLVDAGHVGLYFTEDGQDAPWLTERGAQMAEPWRWLAMMRTRKPCLPRCSMPPRRRKSHAPFHA
jgi:hypothetical protein